MTTVNEMAVLIGEVAADPISERGEAPVSPVSGVGQVVGRMAGVLLLNDGGTGGWLPTDRFGVRLAYAGGDVWAVEFLDPNAWWHRRHAYRLSTDVLPMRDGTTLRLDPATVYEIRHDVRDHRDVWDLFAAPGIDLR